MTKEEQKQLEERLQKAETAAAEADKRVAELLERISGLEVAAKAKPEPSKPYMGETRQTATAKGPLPKVQPQKFQIPAEMESGYARASVGFFKPGDTVYFPDGAWRGERPSIRLIPKTKAAYQMLVDAWGADNVYEKHGTWVEKVDEAPPPIEPKPMDEKGIRAADR